MDAPNLVIQEIATLFGRPRDRAQEAGRKTDSRRQFSHPLQVPDRRYRHDARDDGYVDPHQITTRAEVIEVAIVEEELRADVGRALIDLGLQILHLQQPVRRPRMALGESSDADAETSRIRILVPGIERPDVTDKVSGMLKRVLRPVVAESIAGGDRRRGSGRC